MADDVEMTPVEMTPVEAAEPPKADPLATPKATLKLAPQVHNPVSVATTTAALKPGLKLPPKPSMATGLKLPPKPGMATGLKLPTVAMKPGVKLPPKPVIRKPGATVTAVPLPKPVLPKPVTPQAEKPAESSVPAAPKPVSVDAQGVGKLPTVEAKAVDRANATPVVSANPKPLEALKSVTQKLKGITQEIPQQAILRKTGIIAESAMSEAQKEAAKHKTARISLSDAMGVAPVKNENAPMKTIRIKRPADITGATKSLTPVSPSSAGAQPETADAAAAETAAAPTMTQRKTLKISRPGGAVRPSGKFGIKRPSQVTTVAQSPVSGEAAAGGEAPVAEMSDIPEMPMAPMAPVASSDEGPTWLATLSTIVQAAACVAMGALAWFLYQNSQIAYF